MGLGDDIMATAYARATIEALAKEGQTDVKCVFGNNDPAHADYFDDTKNGALKVHWSEVFLNNPNIYQPGDAPCHLIGIPDYPGHRTYIDYNACTAKGGNIERFAWSRDFKAQVGEIYFDDNEKSGASETASRMPSEFIIIEPNVATKGWTNKKAWQFDKFQAVVDALPEIQFVQFQNGYELQNVFHINSPRFRDACAILSVAGAFIGTDGGLHHAAAALNIPAVVLWGHFTSPDILGYKDHINLSHETNHGCGWITEDGCDKCDGSVDRIEIDEVIGAIRELVADGRLSQSRRPVSIFEMVD